MDTITIIPKAREYRHSVIAIFPESQRAGWHQKTIWRLAARQKELINIHRVTNYDDNSLVTEATHTNAFPSTALPRAQTDRKGCAVGATDSPVHIHRITLFASSAPRMRRHSNGRPKPFDRFRCGTQATTTTTRACLRRAKCGAHNGPGRPIERYRHRDSNDSFICRGACETF